MQNLSPMMQQYFKIKEKHKDHLLFFRLGDFYEMFFEDALTTSKELGLTLTGRDCGLEERAPMCGVPYHSCEGYIARLIKKGYKVAICEQMEEASAAKGVVSREVVRVITPGTLMENNLLQEDANNFLCCINYTASGTGMVFADISTGEINCVDIKKPESDIAHAGAITGELARYMPREVVFSSAFLERTDIAKYMREKIYCTADLIDDEAFSKQVSTAKVLSQFKAESLDGLGLENSPRIVVALGGLLHYLEETQKNGIERLITLNIQEESRFMTLDASARSNLELLETQRTGERRGSLLWVLDKTRTPMGKRLIKTWISQPLVNPAEIEKRLNAVDELCDNEILSADISESLSGVFDIERLMTRIVYGNANPREYKTLQAALMQMPTIKEQLAQVRSQFLVAVRADIDPMEDVCQLLQNAVMDQPSALLREGGVIAEGYSSELDDLRALVSDAKVYIATMESEQKEKTGIKNLKISYNRVFGYYIEVTRSNLSMVPDSYIRKQTLAGCERYIIEELKELEEKLLTAHDKAVALEQQLFEGVRIQIVQQLSRIQRSAAAVARLDVYRSFAQVALTNRYTRPVVGLGEALHISEGRHPVIEQLLDMPFIPNDTVLDCGENQISIITGPNMAGKSTYMRQIALIVLMAQIGSFVPADSAKIGVVDGIFTRIGAADDLTSGQSTFMVEMVEVAQILGNATGRSLLILDEIGRGTSTYDGMSIARAVIEYIADTKKLGAKTLFATHYHELTEMESDLKRVKNYNIAVKKRGDDITFLYKIIRGGADDSYGIEVSKLAGIPQWIVSRAHEVLSDLEKGVPVKERGRPRATAPKDGHDMQIPLASPASEVEDMLRDVDLNTYTPIEALTMLYKLKEKIKN